MFPRNLQDFPFTSGSDWAWHSEKREIKSNPTGPVFAIRNDVPGIDAGAGNDVIAGLLTTYVTTADALDDLSGLLNLGAIIGGDGFDSVRGGIRVLAENGSQIRVSGIDNGAPEAVIDLGDGVDTVIGWSKVSSANQGVVDVVATGIALHEGTIDTGRGPDWVIGKAVVEGWGASNVLAQGIRGGNIDTGLGNDKIIASARAATGDNGTARADAVRGVDIDTGSGHDTIRATATLKGGEGSFLEDTEGLDQGTHLTGRGHDSISATVTAVGTDGTNIVNNNGMDNVTMLDAGRGHDRVVSTVLSKGGEQSFISNNDGIQDSNIRTDQGKDFVFAMSLAIAQDGSTVVRNNGINLGSQNRIDTGDGSDLIFAAARIDGNNLAGAYGDGIGNPFGGPGIIDMGSGNDKLIAIGAGYNLGDTSEGIDGTDIYLGHGNDFVYARGSWAGSHWAIPHDTGTGGHGWHKDCYGSYNSYQGAGYGPYYSKPSYPGKKGGTALDSYAGIRDAIIDGGSGRDVFDLAGGTGVIHGGDDIDLLILEMTSADYDFIRNGTADDMHGNIARASMTDIDVTNVELFQFNDGRFHFEELFVV